MSYARSIAELKRRAVQMGLCGEYTDAWNKAKNSNDLVRIAADINGADFICAGVAKGWGMSPDFIADNFPDDINRVLRTWSNKYLSALFVKFSGNINVDVTVLTIISSNATVQINEHAVTRIFVSGNCSLNIRNGGNIMVYCYDNSVVNIENTNSKAKYQCVPKEMIGSYIKDTWLFMENNKNMEE